MRVKDNYVFFFQDIASHNLEVFFRSTFKGEIVPFDAKGYVTSSKGYLFTFEQSLLIIDNDYNLSMSS